MSKDRDMVFQTTRVRAPLKNDLSWIQNPKSPQKNQEKPCEEPAVNAVKTRPSPVRQNSYVLTTAKKFELHSPTKEPEQNLLNSEAVSPVHPVEPPVANTATESQKANAESHDQEHTEEAAQSSEPEQQPVANKSSENEDRCADSNEQSCVEDNKEIAPSPAEVTVEGVIQNGEARPQILEPESLVEPEPQPIANTSSETQDIHASSHVQEHIEETAQSSEDVTVKDIIQNCEAQPQMSESESLVEPEQQPAAYKSSENEDRCAESNEQSCVENNEEIAPSPAEVKVEDVIQNGEARPQILEPESLVEPEPQPIANTSSETQDIHASSHVQEHIEETAQSSEDVTVKDVIQNCEAQLQMSESESLVEPEQQPAAYKSSENEDRCAESNEQSCVENNEEIAPSPAEVKVEDVIQNGEDPPQILEPESLDEPEPQPVANTASETQEVHDEGHIEETPHSSEDITMESESPVKQEAQPVPREDSENKEGCSESDQSCVENNEETALSPAEVTVEEVIPNSEAQPHALESGSCVEPEQQPDVNTAQEKKEEFVDAPINHSNIRHTEEAMGNSGDIEGVQNGEAQCISKSSDEVSASPVEDIKQAMSKTASENNERSADVLDDQSHVEHTVQTVQSSVGAVVEEAESSGQQDELPGNNILSEKEEFVDRPNRQSNNEGVPEASADVPEETEERKGDEVPEVLTPELQLDDEHSSQSDSTYLTMESNSQLVEAQIPSEVTEETVANVVEVVLESPDARAKVHSEATAECPIASIESEVESETLVETPVSKPEKEVRSDVQPDGNGPDEQNVEPIVEATADYVAELNIEDALKPLTPTEGEAVENKQMQTTTEVVCTSDEEAPAVDTIPERAVEEGSKSEGLKPKQQHDDSNIDENHQKPVEAPSHPQAVPEPELRDDQIMCSFCDQVIGNVKITLSEPDIKCHPECLKCAVCAKILGDFITPMFLHDQKVHCVACFSDAFQI